MSLSRRARRAISIFQKIQWNPKRAMYHLSPKRMINLDVKPPLPPLNPELAAAATEAMEILVRNGERANANVQELPESQGSPVPPVTEGKPEHDVPVQPQDGEDRPQSGPAGA